MSKLLAVYESLCPLDRVSKDDPRRGAIIWEMRQIQLAKTDEDAAKVIAYWGDWGRDVTALDWAKKARQALKESK